MLLITLSSKIFVANITKFYVHTANARLLRDFQCSNAEYKEVFVIQFTLFIVNFPATHKSFLKG